LSQELLEIARRSPGVTDPYSNAWTLLRLARRRIFDAIAVSTPSSQQFLAERGVASEHVPLGWWPYYGDCLVWNATSTSSSWVSRRPGGRNRTRVLLNLSRHPGLLSACACSSEWRTERSSPRSRSTTRGRTARASTSSRRWYPTLPGLIRHHIEHENERAAIAVRAHRFVTEEATLAASVDRIAALIERVSAARGSGSSR
jgi:hypothetical protein